MSLVIDWTGKKDKFLEWLKYECKGAKYKVYITHKEIIARPGKTTRTYDYGFIGDLAPSDINYIKESIEADDDLRDLRVYEPKSIGFDPERDPRMRAMMK